MIFSVISIIVFIIFSVVVILHSAFKLYDDYIRYKSIGMKEFQTMARGMDKATGSKDWRKNNKIYSKVYRAANKARKNEKNNYQ